MEAVFKDFPNVDVVYVVGEDYYLSEPKHLGEDVKIDVQFRNEEAKLKFEASKGVFSEIEKSDRIAELSLELEDLKAKIAESEALNVSLKSENEALKAEVKTKTEK